MWLHYNNKSLGLGVSALRPTTRKRCDGKGGGGLHICLAACFFKPLIAPTCKNSSEEGFLLINLAVQLQTVCKKH